MKWLREWNFGGVQRLRRNGRMAAVWRQGAVLTLLAATLAGHVCAADGVYVFAATQVVPAVPAGKQTWALRQVTTADGAVYVTPAESPADKIVYWRLKGVPEGRYYLTLDHAGATQVAVWLNGVALTRGTRTIAESVALLAATGTVEISQSRFAGPVAIRDGDVVTVKFGREAGAAIGRLCVQAGQPPAGGLREQGSTAGAYESRVETVLRFKALPGERRAEAVATVANRMPDPQTITLRRRLYGWNLRDGVEETREVVLEAFAEFEWKTVYPLAPDTAEFRLMIEVTDGTGLKRTYARSILADAVEGPRRRAWLNGAWEFVAVPGLELGAAPSAQAEWQKLAVPGPWPIKAMGPLHCGWFRKQFVAPAHLQGERIVLHFERVSLEGTIYLNGRKIGMDNDGATPFELDVTGVLRPGATNELLVGVRDFIAGMDPAFLKNNLNAKGEYVVPHGNFPGCIRPIGISCYSSDNGIIDDVYLLARPALHVADVFVTTSLKRKQLAASVTLQNDTQQPEPIEVIATVYDGARKLFELPPRQVTAGPGATPVDFAQAWRNPRPWWPRDPQLYTLAVVLRKPGAAPDLDRLETRIGFREIEIVQDAFMLNGKRIKFRGGPPLFCLPNRDQIADEIGGEKQLAMGSDITRLHVAKVLNACDLADEMGIATVPETLLCNSFQHYFIRDPRFWAACTDHVDRFVRNFRRHPSVLLYSLGNEVIWTYGGEANENLIAREEGKLIERARALDPTRPAYFDSDGDSQGAAPAVALHYPRDVDIWPFGTWWRRINDGTLLARLKYNRSLPVLELGRKPVMFAEVASGPTVFGAAEWMGNEAYKEAAGNLYNSMVAYLQRYIGGTRDFECGYYVMWDYSHFGKGLNETVYPRICVISPSQERNYFGGERVKRMLNVHHDVFRTEPVVLAWRLRQGDAVLQHGRHKQKMGSYELWRTTVEFRVPEVTERTDLRLELDVLADGATVFQTELPLAVFPKQQVVSGAGAALGLFDPKGTTGPALAALGVQYLSLQTIGAQSLAPLKALVLGDEAVSRDTLGEEQAAALEQFVKSGGRVLALKQAGQADWVPLRLKYVNDAKLSRTFISADDHPVFRHVREADLSYWQGDHVVAHALPYKPEKGNALALADGGYAMSFAPLLEVYHGAGSYLLSQFEIVGKFNRDPAAPALLKGLVEYLGQPVYRRPQKSILLAAAGAPLQMWLDMMGVEYRAVPVTEPAPAAALGNAAPVILDGTLLADGLPDAWLTALREHAKSGGTVLIHGAGKKGLARLSALVGQDLAFEEIARGTTWGAGWDGRAYRVNYDPLLAGLSNHTLFWRQDAVYHTTTEQYLLHDLAEFQVRPKGSKYESLMLYPSVIVSLPCGKGRFVIDQTLWHLAGQRVPEQAMQTTAVLLTNLGIQMRMGLTAREQGELLPISLAAYGNRDLKDDDPGNGKGGWTDQGGNDMREFPTGRVTFNGIPFDIPVTRACIVLRTANLCKECPEKVEGIAVGARAAALYFLHTCAYGGTEVMGKYRVNYVDGTSADISIRGGVNIADWWTVRRDLPAAEVAWTGKNPERDPVCVYMFRWQNPHPEKKVSTIAFESAMAGSVPILMGITVRVPGKDGTLVRNGGFEEIGPIPGGAAGARTLREGCGWKWEGSELAPVGWTLNSGYPARIGVVAGEATAHSGRVCILLGPATRGDSGHLYQSGLTVTPGVAYQVSCWHRRAPTKAGEGFSIGFYTYGAQGGQRYVQGGNFKSGAEWAKAEATVRFDKDVASAALALVANKSGGVLLDDVAMVPLPVK